MTDRRIRKTEHALQNAFAQIIQTKELPQITVKELCELADVNKSTFYLHYHDIYDLASSMKRQFLNDCYHIIAEDDILQFAANSPKIWSSILKLFQEKNSIYIAFINSPSIFSLAPSVDECILIPLMEKAKKDHPGLSHKDLYNLRMAITFITNGFIGLIQSVDFQDLPEATMFIASKLNYGF